VVAPPLGRHRWAAADGLPQDGVESPAVAWIDDHVEAGVVAPDPRMARRSDTFREAAAAAP